MNNIIWCHTPLKINMYTIEKQSNQNYCNEIELTTPTKPELELKCTIIF